MKKQQEQETMDALQEHFANRDKPKAQAPVSNELAAFNDTFARHAAIAREKERADLEAVFAKRNALRATKSK